MLPWRPIQMTQRYDTWLDYISKKCLNVLHKGEVLKGIKQCKLDLCKFCIMGKQNRVSFKKAEHTSTRKMDYIHFDVWGPAPINS